MSKDAYGVTYHRLHHFLTEAPWNAGLLNERRLQVMQQCSQTKIRRGFTLIIDDSGHRKSGKLTQSEKGKQKLPWSDYENITCQKVAQK